MEFDIFGFLVLHQEDLSVFTNKSPIELMNLFEKISGSYIYKNPYLNLQNNIQKVSIELLDKNEQLKSLNRDKKHVTSLLHGNENATKLFQDLDLVSQEILELSLLRFHLNLRDITINIHDIGDKSSALINKVNNLTSELGRLESNKRELNKGLNASERHLKIKELEKQKNIIGFNKEKIENYKVQLEVELTKEKDDLQRVQESFKQIEIQSQILNKEIEAKKQLANELLSIKMTNKQKQASKDVRYLDFVKRLFPEQTKEEELQSRCKIAEEDIEFTSNKLSLIGEEISNCLSEITSNEINLQNKIKNIVEVEEQIAVIDNQKIELSVANIKINEQQSALAEAAARIRELEAQLQRNQ